MIEQLISLSRRCEESNRAVAARKREVTRFGPFEALINLGNDMIWLNYAVPVEELNDSSVALAALADLKAHFRARNRRPRFEFNAAPWPDLQTLLETVGLTLQDRQPLMACEPGDVRPCPVPGVVVHMLSPGSPDKDFVTLSKIQAAAFGEAESQPSAEYLHELRTELESGQSLLALATLDGVPVGAGGILPDDAGVGELVGVATLSEARRRGVAAAVSARLTADFFARGGELAWLSAADSGAQAVYSRVGYQMIDERINMIM